MAFLKNSKNGNFNIYFNSYCIKIRNCPFINTVRISHTHTSQCQNGVDFNEIILCPSWTTDHLNNSLAGQGKQNKDAKLCRDLNGLHTIVSLAVTLFSMLGWCKI